MVHRSGSACFSPQRSPNVSGPDMNLIKEPEPDCLPLMDAGRLPNDDPLQDTGYSANYHPTPVLISTNTESLTDNEPIATANTVTSDNVADSNPTSPDRTICRPEHSLRCTLPLNKLRRILHKIRPMKRNINNSTNIVPKISAPALTVGDVVVSDSSIAPSAGTECDKLADSCAVDEVGTKMKTKTGVLTVGRVLCLYCDRSFVTASLQNRHVQRVHRENPGRRSSGRTAHLQAQGDFNGCGFCSETATARSTNLLDLFAHMLEKHADKYFACRKCVVRFTTSENLNIHLSEVHGQSVDLKVVLRNSDLAENVADKRVRKVTSPEFQVENVNAIDFEQNIAVNILSMGIAGPIEHKTNPKMNLTESSNSPQTKVSQKPQKLALNNSAQEQNEPMLSRLGITQNRSPGSKKTSKMRKNDLKASLNDKKIKLKPDIQEFFINKNINSKNELFDSRFDKNFYENVSKNVCENLSNYLDGKINNIPGMSGSDNGLVSPPTLSSDSENRVRIHESNSSLTTISSFPTLLSSEQYGAIGPPNNPKLPRKKATKNSWKWKFDFVKKYKYYNENGKMVKKVKPTFLGTRDLSKLDMWTQLTMRNKYDLEKSKDKRNNEEEQTECDERKEKLRLLSELNSILDTRLFPKLNLEQECSPLVIKKETESHIEKSENEVKFTRRKSCRINDICASLAKVTASNLPAKTVSDDSTLDSIRNNKQNSNLKENTSVPLLDCLQPRIDSAFTPVASTSSSSEVSFSNYLNLKPKTNIPNGLNSPEVYLSGEWERPRCYICVGCGLKLNTLKELEDHKSTEHPHIFSTYYEIVGKEMINSEVYKLFHLPGAQNTGKLLVDIKQNNGLAKGLTGDSVACTKCSKAVALSERFRHMLECSGDSYLLAKKKSRYRPFGSRSRRRKARLHGCKVPRRMPTTVMKKIRRNTKTNIPRSKPSDAETIQRMLANLPAKRLSRHIVPLPRPRQRLKKQVQVKQKTNVQQPKVIPGNRHLLNNRASRSRTFLQAGSHKPTWTELQRLKNSKQTRNVRKTTMSKRIIKDDVDIDSDVDVETVDAEESTETDTESDEIDVETVDSNPVFTIAGNKKTTGTSDKKISKTSKTVSNKSKKDAENTRSTAKINLVENNNKIRQAKIKRKTEKFSQDNIKKASLKNTVLPKTDINILDIEKDKVDKNSTKKLVKPKHNLKGKSSIIDVTDHKKNKSAIDASKEKSITKNNSKKKAKVNASAKIEFEKKLDRVINNGTENISAFEPINGIKDILPVQEAMSSVGALEINSNIKIKIRSKKAAKNTEKTSLKNVKTSINKSKSAKKSNTIKGISAEEKQERLNIEKLDSINKIAKYDPDSDSKSDDFPLAHIKMRYKNKTQVLKNKANYGRKNNKKIKSKTNQLMKQLPPKSKKSRKCKLTDNLKENIIIVNEFIANGVKNIECGDKEPKSCIVEKTLNDSDIMPTLEKVSPVSSEKSDDTCPILSPIVDNTSRRVAPLMLKPNCALNITPLLDTKLVEPESEVNLKINISSKSDFEEPGQTAAIETETEVNQAEINKKQEEKQRTNCVTVSSDLDKMDLAQTEINDAQIPNAEHIMTELDAPTNSMCIVENAPAKLIKSPNKRRSKKLNDCIAMLTDKLQSKLSDNHINSFNVLESFLLEPLVKNSDPILFCNDKQNSPVLYNEKSDDLPCMKQLIVEPAAINPIEALHEIVPIPILDVLNDKINYIDEEQLMPDDNNSVKRIAELKVTIEQNVEMVDVCKEREKSDEICRDPQHNIHFEPLKETEVIHKEESCPKLQGQNIIEGITTQSETIQKIEEEFAIKENILGQVLLKQNEENNEDIHLNKKSSDEIMPDAKTSKIKRVKKTQTKKTEKIVLPLKRTRKNNVPETVLESTICENSSLQKCISTIADSEINSVINTTTHLDGKSLCSNKQESDTPENHQVYSILSESNEVLDNGVIDLKKGMISCASNVTLESFESTDSQNENASNSNELFISSLSANDEQYIQNALEIPNVLLNSNDEILNDLIEPNKSISKTKSKKSRKIKHIVAGIDSTKVLERSQVSSRKSSPRKCKFSPNVTNIENEVKDVFSEIVNDKRKVDLSSKKKEKIRKHKKKISPFNDCSLIANEQLLSKIIPLEDQSESDVQESLGIIADANDDKITNNEKTMENKTETEMSNLINMIDIAFDAKKSPTVLENDSDFAVSNLLNVTENVKLDVNKSPIVVEKDSNIFQNSNVLTKYEMKDNETNFVMNNEHLDKNKKSDTDIVNVQNIHKDLLDDIGIDVKSNNVENSDSEEDICLAVMAKILQRKPEISNDDTETCNTEKECEKNDNMGQTDMKLQHSEIDVEKEKDSGESLCTKVLLPETKSDSMNDTIETFKIRKKRRYKKSVLCNTRKNKQIKTEKIPEALVNDLLNYCEICKKSFQRIESLNKHKMTLTHIAKLSEIEFLNKRNCSKVNVLNDMSELNDVKMKMDKEDSDKTVDTETPIEDKSEKLSVDPQDLAKEFIPHLEILNDVEEVDGENINSLENSVSDDYGLSSVNELVDVNNRKALSVEEALFFECCSLLKSSEATKNEMAPQPKSLSVNPYPILPSAAEVQSLKLNHYSNKFSDISSDSNNLPTIQHMDLPKLQEDSCGSNLTAFLASVDQFISTPLVNHAENNEYSPISNDANFSPISNAGSPDKLDCFETDFTLQEPSQAINNFSPISDQSESENITCNIYTKTISTITLQETYMESDEICHIAKELRSPNLETNLYKSREELYSVENMIVHSNSSFSDMGDSCPPSLANSVEDSEALDQQLPKLNQLNSEKSNILLGNEQARIHNTGFGINEDLKCKRIQGNESDHREIDSNSSLPSSPHSNKKIPTKGALKVFESLKVSIPTSEFNLKKVISSCANSKLAAFVEIALQSEQSNEPFSNEQYEDNEIVPKGNFKKNTEFLNNGEHIDKNIKIDKSHKENYLCEFNLINDPKEKQEIDHSEDIISVTHTIKVKKNSPRKQDSSMLPNTKKKNLVLKFGNNLGFRIKKRRVNDKRKHKTNNKNKNKASNKLTIKDIYDFEDSQDNVDFTTNKLASYVSNKFSSKCDLLNNSDIEIQHNGDNQKDSGNIPVSDGDDDDDDGFDYLSDHLTDISSIESSEVVKPRIDTEGNPKQLIVGKIFRKNLKEKPEKPNLDELFDNLLSENIENTKCEKIEIKVNENELLDKSKVASDISKKNVSSTEKEYNIEDNLEHKEESKDRNTPLKMKARKNRSKSTIEQELGMSFQQIKEIIGFAQRKSQRKCTTGKQNVLAENWSSDEDFGSRNKKDKTKVEKRFSKEHVDQKLHIKSQIKSEVPIALVAETDNIPTSSEAVENVMINNKSDKKKQVSKDQPISCKENDVKGTNGPIENGFCEIRDNLFTNNGPTRIKRRSHRSLAEDSSSDSECDSKKKRSRKARRRRRLSDNLKEHQAKLSANTKDLTSSQNESVASKETNSVTFHDNALVETLASSINVETLSCNNKRSKQNPTDLDAQTAAILSLPRRKRVSTDMLYYWSSSSDEDQYAGMIEVKPIRDDVNLTEHPIQHGWIVGDSHKKLVTLLAHTKGKKNEDCVVKESNIKKNRHTL